jgi:hypothetical protein
MATPLIPDWIVSIAKARAPELSPDAVSAFDKTLECMHAFSGHYLDIPQNSQLGVLRTHSPSSLAGTRYERKEPELITHGALELFKFQFVYQVRELGLAFNESLENSRFYAAAVILRTIFESVCRIHYAADKACNRFDEAMKELGVAVKTSSHAEREKRMSNYRQKLHEVYSLIMNDNKASSLDWTSFPPQKLSIDDSAAPIKKVHVNDTIREIGKKSGLPLSKIYDLLSEVVHPNAGSKMLVVSTRRSHDSHFDVLNLGDNSRNEEACLFFIDLLSEALFFTVNLCCSLPNRLQKPLDLLDSWLDFEPKQGP